MASATVESLELRISNKADGVASGIKDITSALKELKLASRNGAGLGDVVNQLNALNAALRRTRALTSRQINIPVKANGLLKATGAAKQNAVASSSSALSGQSAHSGAVESGSSTEATGAASAAVDSYTKKMQELQEASLRATIAQQEYKLSLHGVTAAQAEAIPETATFEEKMDALSLRSMELKVALKEAELETAKLQEAQKKAAEEAKRVAEVQKKVADAMKHLDDSSKKSATGLGKVGEMFKRILLYRAIRGIIQGITQAIKEGIDNLYQWSLLNDGVFAKSMDTLASCATNAKNALAVAFAPAINAIVPIVQFATNAIVTLGNAISWLFAKLKGAATYTRVNTDYMTQYGKAATSAGGAAGKAAKEMQRTILGFDEINKLNSDMGGSSGGGGGGGGVSGSNYNDMFELANVESAWQSFKDNLQNTINKAREAVDAFLDEHPKLKKVVGPILKVVREAWGAATQDIVANTDFVNSKYKEFNDHCKSSLDGVNSELKQFNTNSKTEFGGWANTVATKTKEGMSTMTWEISKNLSSTKTQIISWVSAAKGAFNEFTGNTNDSLSDVEEKFRETQGAISEFTSESQKNMGSFAKGMEEKAKQGMKGHTSNIYNGLMNSSDNISLWDSMTSKSMDSWASSTTSTVAGWAKSVVNSIANACQEAFNNIKNLASSTGAKYNLPSYTASKNVSTSTYSGSGGKGNWKNQQQLKLYAAGGFPIVGDLFIANERGPELVGSMNNRPAVANQQQIIEGISQGVARAMMTQEALLREQNDLLRSRGDVVVTTGSIVDSFSRMNRRSGTTVVPVGG